MKISLPLLILFFSVSSQIWADEADITVFPLSDSERIGKAPSENFYKKEREGWYWYHDPEEKTEEEAEDEEKILSTPQPAISLKADPWKLSVDQFKGYLEEAKKEAIRYPTEENMLRYLEAQDVARRRAKAFSSVYMFMIQKHPEFSVAAQTPLGAAGRQAILRMRQAEIGQTIDGAGEEFTLIYFCSDYNPMCKAQEFVMDSFGRRHPYFSVRRVNVDNNPLLAESLNIFTTPYFILLHGESMKHFPVGTGVMTVSAMEKSLYKTIRYLRGDISPEQFLIYDFEVGTAMDPRLPREHNLPIDDTISRP